MATTASGVTIPGASPTTTPATPIQDHWNNLGKSLNGRIIVPVASVTARAALVTALTADGYAISASNPLYTHRADAPAGFNLEVTTNGTTWQTLITNAAQSLVIPTSVAGAGVTLSGGSIALAAATSASVNGCFSTVFDNYKILLDVSTASAPADLSLLMRAAGADTTTTVYLGFQISMASATPSYGYQAAGNTGMICGRTNGGGGSGVEVSLLGPNLAEYTKLSTPMNMDAAIGRICGGTVMNTVQYDGFTINTGGAVTMTGKIRVYGWNNG